MSSHNLIESYLNRVSSFAVDDIVEIGSVREETNEDNSTAYFHNLSLSIQCSFYTVDLSEESYRKARDICGAQAFNMDGSIFLSNYRSYSRRNISILYLDNYDVVYNDTHRLGLERRVGSVYTDHYSGLLCNEKSAEVHLSQAIAAMPYLVQQALVCIDDTKQIGVNGYWGKGASVVPFLYSKGFVVIDQSTDGVLMGRGVEVVS